MSPLTRSAIVGGITGTLVAGVTVGVVLGAPLYGFAAALIVTGVIVAVILVVWGPRRRAPRSLNERADED